MKHLCMVCGQPIGKDGSLCTINEISVALCREHSRDCDQNCDSCIHASICPVCGGRG